MSLQPAVQHGLLDQSDRIARSLGLAQTALAKFAYIEFAVLFGSLVKGTETPNSDVDVAVLANTALSARQRIELIDALAFALGRPVDLIDLRTVGQPLLNQILKYGRRLMGSDEQMAMLVYRNLVDRADLVPLRNRIQKKQSLDFDVVAIKLESLEHCIDRIEATCPPTIEQLQQDIDAQDIVTLNLSRAVQLAVDISSHIFVSSKAPAPQTMGESFEAMNRLGVLDSELAMHLRKSVGFRKIAVHNYEAINWEVVYSIVTERLDDFTDFARAVQNWLDASERGTR